MTKATTILPLQNSQFKANISYQVAMPFPESHLFEVTLKLENWQESELILKMPVWTPGSYLVREYAKQVQDFVAIDSRNKKNLFSQKISKNTWQVLTENIDEIQVKYRVFANELSVRTNHLDSSHGYFNGAALFFLIPGLEKQAITITIIPWKKDWQVITCLPKVLRKNNTFLAEDFDTLVDSPFEIGKEEIHNFNVLNKPHQLVIWGKNNLDVKKAIEDTKKIIIAEADLYGDLPYDEYLFILHCANGYGGLEHKNCCSLLYPRFGFKDREKYHQFIQLVAHEFFHLWNVKRIRPKALESFDYEQENYTTSLWFSEGTTSYYDILIPWRAGIYNAQTFLNNLSKEITRFLNTPGRKVQCLHESSFDAWIKLYRRDANSDNSQISYYLKGEMVSFLLDLLIRERHQNKRSLDDVMRQMWQKFGKEEIGFSPEQLQTVIESVAEIDLSEFFACYLDSTEELPFNKYLEPFGLQLKPILEQESIPYLGIKVRSENGKDVIKFVEADSPAAKVGIDPEDELLALDGWRITSEQLNERLKNYQSGDTVSISLFHQDELKNVVVELEESSPNRYEIVYIKDPSSTQKENLAGWLNVNL